MRWISTPEILALLFQQLAKYLLYALGVAFLLRVAPLRRIFASLPRGHRRLLLGMFSAILFVQVIEAKYETYPFVNWGMYDRFGGNVRYFEYAGVRPDGVEEPIPVARLLRIYQPLCPTCSKRLVWRLKALAMARSQAKTEAERARAVDLYERTLRAAWAVYAARNPRLEYEQIRVWESRFRAADYVDASSIQRNFVWSVRLDEQVPHVE